MERRSFLKSLAVAPAATLAWPGMLDAALPKAKITRVRIYTPPRLNPSFNQSDMIVTVETDAGITGIGEGGVKDTLEQCAGSIVGQNPFQIERLWRKMYMEWFYPPGREKIHSLGAIDLALWDIKGKALGLPVHERTRRYGKELLRVLSHHRHPRSREPEPEGTRGARGRGGLPLLSC